MAEVYNGVKDSGVKDSFNYRSDEITELVNLGAITSIPDGFLSTRARNIRDAMACYGD